MLSDKLTALPLSKIKIQDHFWSKYTELVKDVIIPYQWSAINDQIPGAEPSHSLANFEIAAGLKQGEFHGAVFQDTDVAKWLEAVAYSLGTHPDPELEATADRVIDTIRMAQGDDGYINTYFTLQAPDKRWSDLGEGHELYSAGHLIEAAVAYYENTGKREFLDVMIRFADLISQTFGPADDQIHGYPGHQEIELALVKLYRTTGQRNYLETAKYFIETRGQGENYFLKEQSREGFEFLFPEFKDYLPVYSQSHLPVREQITAEGHAVRATYMYCAMADLAYEFQDASLLNTCKTLWQNIVDKRMYITGSIGSSGILERFTTDYDLPNDINYSETCASIGLALFGLRMNQITRESKYIDVVERSLYNTVLSGVALDGKSFFYVNPLEVWPDCCLPRTSREHIKPVRQKWFGVACCPPNVARTLASLGQYIFGADEANLYVNLYISSDSELKLGGQDVSIRMKTDYPFNSIVEIEINSVQITSFSLNLRIPAGCFNPRLKINGQVSKDWTVRNGYIQIQGNWQGQTRVDMEFDMPVQLIHANPQVRADIGKVAVVKGPIVYCIEEVDNGNLLAANQILSSAAFSEQFQTEILGGTIMLETSGEKLIDQCDSSEWGQIPLYRTTKPGTIPVKLKFIPYCLWGNRKTGEMLVWIRYRD